MKNMKLILLFVLMNYFIYKCHDICDGVRTQSLEDCRYRLLEIEEWYCCLDTSQNKCGLIYDLSDVYLGEEFKCAVGDGEICNDDRKFCDPNKNLKCENNICKCISDDYKYNKIRQECVYYPPDIPSCYEEGVAGDLGVCKDRKVNHEYGGYCCLITYRWEEFGGEYYNDATEENVYYNYYEKRNDCENLLGLENYYIEDYAGDENIFEIACSLRDGIIHLCFVEGYTYNESADKCKKQVGINED